MNPSIMIIAGWLDDETSLTTSDGPPMVVVRLAVGMPPYTPGPDSTHPIVQGGCVWRPRPAGRRASAQG